MSNDFLKNILEFLKKDIINTFNDLLKIKNIFNFLRKNSIESIILFFLFIIFFIIIGKIFHINNLCHIHFLTYFWNELDQNFNHKLLIYLFISFYALFTLLILSIRNKQLEKQSETQYKIFLGNSELENFLKASELLTKEDSTVEAKISALYLLYDIAKRHNENLDRIIQIINKFITKLVSCLDNKSKCEIILYKNNERYDFLQYLKKYHYLYKEELKDWKYKGNSKQKLISTALEILKEIFINIILERNLNNEYSYINLSHTILFDIDKDFINKDIIFDTKNKSTENLFFLGCKLRNSKFKVIYHHCYFYYCDLSKASFKESNLWGNYFFRCDFKNVNFKNCECEGVVFEDCKNLTSDQIKNMKFSFKDKIKNKDEFIKKLVNKEIIDEECEYENFYPIILIGTEIKQNNIITIEKNKYSYFMEVKNEYTNN